MLKATKCVQVCLAACLAEGARSKEKHKALTYVRLA